MLIVEIHYEGISDPFVESKDLKNEREEKSKEEQLACQVVSLYSRDGSDTKYRLLVVAQCH